jgi:hypothetical protein
MTVYYKCDNCGEPVKIIYTRDKETGQYMHRKYDDNGRNDIHICGSDIERNADYETYS